MSDQSQPLTLEQWKAEARKHEHRARRLYREALVWADALRAALRSLQVADPTDMLTKIEALRYHADRAEKMIQQIRKEENR